MSSPSVQIILFLFYCLSLTAASMTLPDYIKPCKLDSNFDACAVKSANLAIPTLIKGDPKWKIPILDPLSIKIISISENGSRNVALNVSLIDLKLKGMKDAKVLSARFDMNKKHVQLLIEVPRLTLVSKYTISGRFLILPITGSGPATVFLDNVNLTYSFDYKLIKKNNEDYVQIVKSNVKYSTTKLQINLEHLFNGDKTLGDTTNALINENWMEFNDQLGPSVAQSIGAVITRIVGNFVKNVPFKNLFAK